MKKPILLGGALAVALILILRKAEPAPLTLLNVSYDPTRELYQEIGAAFAADFLARTGRPVAVESSHGGSGAQARAVLGGLKADVVTLALAYDIDALAERGFVAADWSSRFPHNTSPYASTIVFLVRAGNPSGIRGWDDLVRDDVRVITPNPKTSGGARWNFLAAWGHVTRRGGSEEEAIDFVRRLYKRVPVLDTGARGSTTTFVQKGIGDVLIAWENEALLAAREAGDKVQVVLPEDSILAEPPVAIVDRNVEANGTRDPAEAFLRFLYTDEAQEIIARAGYRPTTPAVLERHRASFPAFARLATVRDVAGSWKEAHRKFFADGALFDLLYEGGN